MTNPRFHTMDDGRRIAFRKAEGTGPYLVFLPGYMSDMEGGKATALFQWAEEQGRACLLLDYSGCGSSDGDFADGTLSRWREEVLALVHSQTQGPVILIGSSMGGWLMLLCALEMEAQAPGRLAGLVGIAPAPDFTDWGYDPAQKARLAAGETLYQDSDYGYDPMPTHAGFWQDGQANLLLNGPIDLTCPVQLLHGQMDPDVPWDISMRLAKALRSEQVQIHLIKSGDHRLSRDEDIALLIRTLSAMA